MKAFILSVALLASAASAQVVQVNFYTDPSCDNFETQSFEPVGNVCFPVSPVSAAGARLVSCPTRFGCECDLFDQPGCGGDHEHIQFDDTGNSRQCADQNHVWQSARCIQDSNHL